MAQWFGTLLSATALALPCVASLEIDGDDVYRRQTKTVVATEADDKMEGWWAGTRENGNERQ